MSRISKIIVLALFLNWITLTNALASGSVQGFVYAQGTSQALPGATVELSTASCLFIFPSCTATSGADGSFSLPNVAAGHYVASVFYPHGTANYVRATQTVDVVEGSVATLTFYMTPGAAIHGVVTRASDGIGVQILHVSALHAVGDYSFSTISTQDAAGNYTIDQLPAGQYVLSTYQGESHIYQDQYYAGHDLTPPSQSQPVDTITLAAGQIVTGVNFSLVEGGRMRGVLTDSYTGLPITNSRSIYFYAMDPNDLFGDSWLAFASSTDAQGHYEITGLPNSPIGLEVIVQSSPGYALSQLGCAPFQCSGDSPAIVQAPAGTILSGVNLSLFPSVVVEGTVTRRSDGAPIPGVAISARIDADSNSYVEAAAVSDAQGHFALTGNRLEFEGIYLVASNAKMGASSFIDQMYNDHNCAYGVCAGSDADTIEFFRYTISGGLDFHLDPGGAIKGTIVRKSDSAGITASVRLYKSDGTLAATVSSDVNGNFSTSGLQPGTYYLEAQVGSSTDGDCVLFANQPCPDPADIVSRGQSIAIVGTQDHAGIAFSLISDRVFRSSFE